MIKETSDYPITKKQIQDILRFEREGRNSSYISRHVGISCSRVITIGNKARSRGIL